MRQTPAGHRRCEAGALLSCVADGTEEGLWGLVRQGEPGVLALAPTERHGGEDTAVRRRKQ